MSRLDELAGQKPTRPAPMPKEDVALEVAKSQEKHLAAIAASSEKTATAVTQAWAFVRIVLLLQFGVMLIGLAMSML